MKPVTRRRLIELLVGVLTLAGGLASAQVRTSGQVVGTVKDSTGAIVQGALRQRSGPV